MDSTKTPFDTPWKDILEAYFQEFIVFFFLEVHNQIDWTKGFEFMDGELQQLTKESETTRLHTDKLVKVYWLDGSEQLVFLHIEIQCQKEEIFPDRVFTYFARIRDKFKKTVVSLVVLGDDNKTWKPQSLEEELGGCRLRFDFPTVKLLEYKEQREELADSMNPFAHVVLAHLAALATKRNNTNRRKEKFSLTKRLYEKEFDRKDIINLFKFVDWVMTLPPELEASFQKDVTDLERGLKVAYITNIERSGIEKGRIQGERNMVLKFLGKRLNGLSSQIESKVEALDPEQLQELSELLMDTAPIDDLTAWLNQH
jgi:Domain of unknown function (DUF4351)